MGMCTEKEEGGRGAEQQENTAATATKTTT
jgi:hypothetical protein